MASRPNQTEPQTRHTRLRNDSTPARWHKRSRQHVRSHKGPRVERTTAAVVDTHTDDHRNTNSALPGVVAQRGRDSKRARCCVNVDTRDHSLANCKRRSGAREVVRAQRAPRPRHKNQPHTHTHTTAQYHSFPISFLSHSRCCPSVSCVFTCSCCCGRNVVDTLD